MMLRFASLQRTRVVNDQNENTNVALPPTSSCRLYTGKNFCTLDRLALRASNSEDRLKAEVITRCQNFNHDQQEISVSYTCAVLLRVCIFTALSLVSKPLLSSLLSGVLNSRGCDSRHASMYESASLPSWMKLIDLPAQKYMFSVGIF